MKPFYLEPTDDSPRLFFDVDNGLIEFTGRALMVETSDYYQMLVDWLRTYIQAPRPTTLVLFDLEYTNAASEQMIACILGELNKYYIMGHNFQVEWRVNEENESMLEIAEEFQHFFDIPFRIRQMATKTAIF